MENKSLTCHTTSERRLIDAKELAEKIYAIHYNIYGMRNGKTILKEFAEKYQNDVLRTICKAPTVDAVEVVRCKNCKRWKYDAKKMAGLCKRHINYTTQWDFCSYGERREGE